MVCLIKRRQKLGGRGVVTVGSAVFLGLTFLVSGSGKLPGQAEFIDALLQSFWTPGFAYFIGYCLPWVEIALGVFLLLGLFPRIAAAICLPLIAGFMANNAWALSQGLEKFPHCGYCFGIWEEFFGAISPWQALIFDILLLGAALGILLFHREGFLNSQSWFIKRRGGVTNDENSL